MDDKLKATMWCCGAMNEMMNLGLVQAGQWELTMAGIAMFDQLEQQFKPSDEHIIGFSQAVGGEESIVLAGLLSVYRDKKEEMLKKVEEMGEQD